MADFRKWFLALAVVALCSSLSIAQTVPSSTNVVCSAVSGGNPPLVRGEGIAELVGDVVLNCTGGTSVASGAALPQINVQIFLSVNVTSRLLSSSGLSEALLIVDEPGSPSNPLTPQKVCTETSGLGQPGVCSINGVAAAGGTTGVTPALAGAYPGPYNGTNAGPNVFVGRWVSSQPNAITWLGIPFDPPGSNGVRTLRITNVRGYANQIGTSSTLIPSQITEFISISGVSFITLNNPQATVAYIVNGITGPTVTSAKSFVQCISNNAAALGSSSQAATADMTIAVNEGFAYAFKVRNVAQTGAAGVPITSVANDMVQNVPGQNVSTEDGFVGNGVANPSEPASITGGWTTTAAGASGAFANLGNAGKATQGTRIYLNLGNVNTGAQLLVPNAVALTNQSTGTVSGFAVLVGTDNTASGNPTAATATFGATAPAGLTGLAAYTAAGISYGWVNINDGTKATSTAVYEVVSTDPSGLESLTVPLAVAFVANPGNNSPAPTVTGTVANVGAGFAPVSTVFTASTSAPVPRFVPRGTPGNIFTINQCSCNLLFPFVTNQAGFDTGIAVANTSLDPFDTTPQQGTVTLNFYGTPTQPAQTTNAPVPAGQILTFTLSGGGNFGITPAAGFQGYLIASSRFQYCHGLAFITAAGAGATGAGASESYLGIVLDTPWGPDGAWINRTGNFGEMQAH